MADVKQYTPGHRRNASSKSNILRSLVSSKGRPVGPEQTATNAKQDGKPYKAPMAPSSSRGVLGERQNNAQSPPTSPNKRKDTWGKSSRDKAKDNQVKPKKSKSSTNLAGVFARMNRSSKDLSKTVNAEKNKENDCPVEHESAAPTPIWAQMVTKSDLSGHKERPSTSSKPSSHDLLAEINRYTPSDPVYDPHCRGIDLRASIHLTEKEVGRLKTKWDALVRTEKVMAAVAMFQGKTKDRSSSKEKEKEEPPLDPKAVDAQFEAVLAARNIPEPMRQKMRSLTMRVKADFIRQDQGAGKNNSPPASVTSLDKANTSHHFTTETKVPIKDEEDSKSTKRSRTRSRTFTFSRGKKEQKDDGSPAKKPRSQSRSRPTSIVIPSDNVSKTSLTPTTPTGSYGRQHGGLAVPGDYIAYLRQNPDPTKVEVGRLHKLRILLRNETVSWVDAFITQDGMHEIIELLKRTMAIEWREDHEDQLLHESLLCLKGLCTTERAMVELNKFADDLFPALIAMLFDEEKKGPAEYATRTIIFNVLFTYLSSEMNKSAATLEARARKVLAYLGEPPKSENERPVDFVLGMQTPRPYKLWSRELSNVTREVFWIFLHQLNVVPLPKPSSSHSQRTGIDDEERKKILASTYTQRHFPGSRPPVPAAPYIGGVEWDATTYITAHLDLINAIMASIPGQQEREKLRGELQQSGFEKLMGTVLRTCKEKFYSGVHDGLRAWVAAAHEDGWATRFVREGPSDEEIAEQAMKAQSSPKKSPKKKADLPPKLDSALPLEPPKLDLGLDLNGTKTRTNGKIDDDDDDGWLG
ncbi:hypothetical protein BST61_g8489 [Cercospora zeina]